jgi:chitin synthase
LAALERIEIKETIDKQIDHGVDVEKLIENQYNNNDLLAAAQFGTALAAFNAHKAEHDEAINMYWLNKEETLKFSDVRELDDEEIVFWKKLIKKYLSVEKLEPSQKHKLQVGWNDMRDRGVFAFFMLNALWIAFVFPILLAQDRLKDMLYIPIPIPSLYYQPVLIEPLGVLHLAFFAFISLTQFIAMLCHRYNTFQHILASTKLRSNIHEGMRIEDIIDTVKMLQQIKVCLFFFKLLNLLMSEK